MLSIIIPTLGRTDPLCRLFESLQTQSVQDFEVIVVDQNDDNRLEKIVDQESWPFPLLRLQTKGERGAARARNHGLAKAKGDIVIFPDDDCWYPPDFLAKAITLMEQAKCDSLCGRLADENGRDINGRFYQAATWVNRNNIWITQIEAVVFFKREVLAAVGGYSEDLGIGCPTPWQAEEGHDVTLRLMEAGYKTYYDPILFGHHAELNIYNPDASMVAKGRGYARGFGYCLRKHHYSLLFRIYWILRALARCLLSVGRGEKNQAIYYANIALGRLEGAIGWTFS